MKLFLKKEGRLPFMFIQAPQVYRCAYIPGVWLKVRAIFSSDCINSCRRRSSLCLFAKSFTRLANIRQIRRVVLIRSTNTSLPSRSTGCASYTVSLSNDNITSNSSNLGGGVFSGAVVGTTLSLTDTLIQNNKSTNKGGGVFISAGTLYTLDVEINLNTAANAGGGIYLLTVATWLNEAYAYFLLNTAPNDPEVSWDG